MGATMVEKHLGLTASHDHINEHNVDSIPRLVCEKCGASSDLREFPRPCERISAFFRAHEYCHLLRQAVIPILSPHDVGEVVGVDHADGALLVRHYDDGEVYSWRPAELRLRDAA